MGGEIILDAESKIPGKVIGLVGIDNFKNVSSSFNPSAKTTNRCFYKRYEKKL